MRLYCGENAPISIVEARCKISLKIQNVASSGRRGWGWGRWRRRSGAVVSLGNIFIRAGHVNTTGRAGYVTSHPVMALTADCHLDMRPGNYV